MPAKRLIAMITDFGLNDHFAATMKAVILKINREAEIIDITHNIERHDVLDAGFKLYQTYRYFPPHTIFLTVVDPGVGTQRRVLLCSDGEYFYIAPDNGLLSFIYKDKPAIDVYNVIYDHYFLNTISKTFHGRDIFAPLAAHMSKGLYPSETGEKINNYKKLSIPDPSIETADIISGIIVGFDLFGNATTNINNSLVGDDFGAKILNHIIQKPCNCYEEASDSELSIIKGSAGFLEIFIKNRNSKEALKLKRGMRIVIKKK